MTDGVEPARAERSVEDPDSGSARGADIDFWFDPSCPFTWRTSTWLREVAARHRLTVAWRLMSLTILNEENEIPDELRESIGQGARMLRVLAAVGDHHGSASVGALYEALGHRWHDEGRSPDPEVLRAALDAARLPAALVTAADDPTNDEAVRSSHLLGQDRVGTEVGSPVFALRGHRGFFGPVVVPPPAGPDADRLLEAVRLLSTVTSFSEIKTARAPI